MLLRHYLLIIIITILFGSAYPVQKIIFNENVPPILMGSLRMLVVFVFLVPFWKFKIPNKKYWLPLFCFSLSMGFIAQLFMIISINKSAIISPIIIGSQLAIPFAILLSSLFLKETVSIKKWLFIFISFFGVILLGFDPLIRNEIYSLILISIMAFFYASAQVFSRYLKDIKVTLTNAIMGLIGFLSLFITSYIYEGDVVYNIRNISGQSWLLILHAGLFVSIGAHMSMFYLYRMYPVKKVFPFYALFPVFGIFISFLIFYEIPSFITIIGGLIVITATYLVNKED
tara:strand:- start:338 stop:1195 length:858 start_codon:yes stop_codon:yes gene_type:complete